MLSFVIHTLTQQSFKETPIIHEWQNIMLQQESSHQRRWEDESAQPAWITYISIVL